MPSAAFGMGALSPPSYATNFAALADAIADTNAALTTVNSNLSGIATALSTTNSSLSTIGSKIDTTNNKLDTIIAKLEDIKTILSGTLNVTVIP